MDLGKADLFRKSEPFDRSIMLRNDIEFNLNYYCSKFEIIFGLKLNILECFN